MNQCSRHTPCAVTCILILLLAGCERHNEAAGQPAGAAPSSGVVRVTVISPERKTIRQTVDQPAQIEAYEVTPLYAKVSGYVSKMNVDIGDVIHGPKFDSDGKLKPAQSLVELSIPEIADEERQKKAAVAQAQAE